MNDGFKPMSQDEVDNVVCDVVEDFDESESESESKINSVTEEKEKDGEFIGAERCGQLCSALSDLIAGRKGDRYRLTKDEVESLGAALDPVLSKYMPGSANNIGPELSLALVAVSIVAPRLALSLGSEK